MPFFMLTVPSDKDMLAGSWGLHAQCLLSSQLFISFFTIFLLHVEVKRCGDWL